MKGLNKLMKKTIFRLILAVIAAAVTLACFSPVSAESEERELTPPEKLFLREVSPYAAAAALSLKDADSFDYLHTEEGIWNAIAWYTVFKGYDYITLYEVKGVQEAMWPDGTFFPAPQEWIERGDIIATNRGRNIGMSYEFPTHKMLYDNDDMDVSYKAGIELDLTMKFTVKAHIEEKIAGYVKNKDMTIYVKPWNVKSSNVVKKYRAPYTVRNADLPKPDFNYTADDLYEANNASVLLKAYGTVKVTETGDGAYESVTSYYSQGGDPAYMTVERYEDEDDKIVYGYYNGFDYYIEDGHTTANSGLMSDNSFDPDFYTQYFHGDPILLASDEKTMTVAFVSAGIFGLEYDIYTINRSLAVLSHTWKYSEAQYEYDDDGNVIYPEDESTIEYVDYTGSAKVEYGAVIDDSAILAAWTAGVKTVTVNIETFDDGVRSVDIYKVRVPKSWEYLPYEFYEYNCWMNEGYTREYSYPASGANYTLYLTEAMG